MLEHTKTMKGPIVCYRVEGKIKREDIAPAFDVLNEQLEQHERVHMLTEIVDYGGAEGIAMLLTIWRMILAKSRRIKKHAIICDAPWLRRWIRVQGKVLPFTKIKTYEFDDLPLARTWLREKK